MDKRIRIVVCFIIASFCLFGCSNDTTIPSSFSEASNNSTSELNQGQPQEQKKSVITNFASYTNENSIE